MNGKSAQSNQLRYCATSMTPSWMAVAQLGQTPTRPEPRTRQLPHSALHGPGLETLELQMQKQFSGVRSTSNRMNVCGHECEWSWILATDAIAHGDLSTHLGILTGTTGFPWQSIIVCPRHHSNLTCAHAMCAMPTKICAYIPPSTPRTSSTRRAARRQTHLSCNANLQSRGLSISK